MASRQNLLPVVLCLLISKAFDEASVSKPTERLPPIMRSAQMP